MTDKKTTRTPRSFESILKGALSLSLKEQADLRNALNSAITKKVTELKQEAEEAEEITKSNPS